MTEKITTIKTAVPKQAQKTVAARKPAITKKAPVTAPAAAKTTKAVSPRIAEEKKVKKTSKSNKKMKPVRGNFSMPQSDHAIIDELKQMCLKGGVKVKKNQLLRAGLQAIGKLSLAQLKIALAGLDKKPE